jgi:hypothetical protein
LPISSTSLSREDERTIDGWGHPMPQLTDRGLIQAILERDRPWAAYALADLEPGYAEQALWFGAARP